MVQKTYGTGETDLELIPDGLRDYGFDIIIYDEITWESLAEAKAISVTF